MRACKSVPFLVFGWRVLIPKRPVIVRHCVCMCVLAHDPLSSATSPARGRITFTKTLHVTLPSISSVVNAPWLGKDKHHRFGPPLPSTKERGGHIHSTNKHRGRSTTFCPSETKLSGKWLSRSSLARNVVTTFHRC